MWKTSLERALGERLLPPSLALEQRLIERLDLVAVLFGAVARPLGDEARGVDLPVVEVSHLGAEQVMLGPSVTRRDHVADEQRAAQRSIGLEDGGHRHARHPVRERPDVLGRLAAQRGPHGRVLRPQILPVHRVGVEIASQHLAGGIDHRDDVRVGRSTRAQEPGELLTLLEGRSAARRLAFLLEDANHRGPMGEASNEAGELHRLQAGHVAMHSLRAGNVGVDLADDRLFELARDHGVNTRRQGE